MRKNNIVYRGGAHTFGNLQGNRCVDKSHLKKLIALIILLLTVCFFPLLGSVAFAEESGDEVLNQNILDLLEKLDLSALDKLLQEDSDSYLFQFGSTAKEIVAYLIQGNVNSDYSGYIGDLLSIVFKNVINLVPAFATVTAISLLSAVVSAAEGGIIGKSTSKIVHLACYSLIIVIISTMLLGIISQSINCIKNLKRQIEIITPILATLTVLTGGTSSSAIYHPSAIFLSGGAVQIVSGFVFPATVTVVVLNFMSRLNDQISFTGVTALIKSIMKWVIGLTVTVFSLFITAQSTAGSLFDGIIFKVTKFAVSNSVPIVGNFLSGGFDMLTSAGLLIKSSVGICGLVLLLGEVIGPVIMLIAFSIILKIVGAIVQPVGENALFGLLSDLSKDIEFFIAGLLTVAFMYALVIMLTISSANSFI